MIVKIEIITISPSYNHIITAQCCHMCAWFGSYSADIVLLVLSIIFKSHLVFFFHAILAIYSYPINKLLIFIPPQVIIITNINHI